METCIRASRRRGEQIDAAGWTTVFTLAGLSLPDVGVHRDDFSYEQRLSVALLYPVSQFARRLLNSMAPRIPKAIFLDEAWAITSTPAGAKLIPEVSRMGRSRNTALILVSQNAGNLLNEPHLVPLQPSRSGPATRAAAQDDRAAMVLCRRGGRSTRARVAHAAAVCSAGSA